jgi:SnoaL-like domain
MSHQNVTLLRRANKAFNDGDLDAFLALVDHDVDATPRLARMEGSFRGHDGIRRWWDSVRDSFVYFYSEIVEVRDFGDLTLAEVHDRGHGVGSQAEVEQRSLACDRVARQEGRLVVRLRDRGRGTRSRAATAVAAPQHRRSRPARGVRSRMP